MEVLMNNSDRPFYREELRKPLDEIKEDIFFRADSFQKETWYGDFSNYIRLGICQPSPGHALEIQKALKIMGYSTRTSKNKGKIYILPDTGRYKASAQREPER
jgi:hypothetical protein